MEIDLVLFEFQSDCKNPKQCEACKKKLIIEQLLIRNACVTYCPHHLIPQCFALISGNKLQMIKLNVRSTLFLTLLNIAYQGLKKTCNIGYVGSMIIACKNQ